MVFKVEFTKFLAIKKNICSLKKNENLECVDCFFNEIGNK